MSEQVKTVVVIQDDKYSVEYDIPHRRLVWKAFGRVQRSFRCQKWEGKWSVSEQSGSWQQFDTLLQAADFVMKTCVAIVRTGQGEQA